MLAGSARWKVTRSRKDSVSKGGNAGVSTADCTAAEARETGDLSPTSWRGPSNSYFEGPRRVWAVAASTAFIVHDRA